MRTVLAFVAGLVCAAAAFAIAHGGILGLASALVAASLGYVAASMLTEPTLKLGGVLAEQLPSGRAAALAVERANAFCGQLRKRIAAMLDGQVRKEADDILAATNNLAAFVTDNPASHGILDHFLNVYAQQTLRLVDGYLGIERTGVREQIVSAKRETIGALQALETTAAGELMNAVKAKSLSLSADSDAIKRLANMDGYQTDEADAEPNGMRRPDETDADSHGACQSDGTRWANGTSGKRTEPLRGNVTQVEEGDDRR